jgi:PII-like signaling protein
VKSETTGKLLRIFVGEHDRWKGQPLYTAVVEVLRRRGFAGATAFKGIEGFGEHAVLHAARLIDVSTDLPVLIEVVDSEEKIRALLPVLEEMIREGMVTIETVEVIHYRPAGPRDTSPGARKEERR